MIERAHQGCPTCGWLGREARRTALAEGWDEGVADAPTTDDPHGHWARYQRDGVRA